MGFRRSSEEGLKLWNSEGRGAWGALESILTRRNSVSQYGMDSNRGPTLMERRGCQGSRA